MGKATVKVGLAVATGILAVIGVAWAARPLAVDDADTLARGQCELEIGASFEQTETCDHWEFPFGISCGVIERLQVGIGFGGQFEERTELLENCGSEKKDKVSGIGDLNFGAKWQVIQSCPLGARHAVAPSVKFPAADEDEGLGSGHTDYDVTWIASRNFGKRVGVHFNCGYAWIGGPDKDILHCGGGFEFQISEALQWVGELFGEKELRDESESALQYNTGFRWSPSENLTVDVAGGSRLTGDTPDFTATAGLTWNFGVF